MSAAVAEKIGVEVKRGEPHSVSYRLVEGSKERRKIAGLNVNMRSSSSVIMGNRSHVPSIDTPMLMTTSPFDSGIDEVSILPALSTASPNNKLGAMVPPSSLIQV